MDIESKISHLERQIAFLVDMTEGQKQQINTSNQALSSIFLNLLNQVESIHSDYLDMSEQNSQPTHEELHAVLHQQNLKD